MLGIIIVETNSFNQLSKKYLIPGLKFYFGITAMSKKQNIQIQTVKGLQKLA